MLGKSSPIQTSTRADQQRFWRLEYYQFTGSLTKFNLRGGRDLSNQTEMNTISSNRKNTKKQ